MSGPASGGVRRPVPPSNEAPVTFRGTSATQLRHQRRVLFGEDLFQSDRPRGTWHQVRGREAPPLSSPEGVEDGESGAGRGEAGGW